MSKLRPVLWAIGGAILGAGAVSATYHFMPVKPQESDAVPFRGLDANLYMQSSAEYRACCLQAFALAEQRVRTKLATRAADGKPAAVVLDLDETVIDNGVFQARQLRAGQAFDSKLWDEWEENGGKHVRLIPGAKEFLDTLTKLDVKVVFLSNRSERFRSKTHDVLKRLEIDVPDDRLLLLTSDTSTDKTGRRTTAAEKLDVLLLVGDNLRDFDEVFKFDKAKGLAARSTAVDERRARFGADWIILPNVAYGEWTKPFSNTSADTNLLLPNGD